MCPVLFLAGKRRMERWQSWERSGPSVWQGENGWALMRLKDSLEGSLAWFNLSLQHPRGFPSGQGVLAATHRGLYLQARSWRAFPGHGAPTQNSMPWRCSLEHLIGVSEWHCSPVASMPVGVNLRNQEKPQDKHSAVHLRKVCPVSPFLLPSPQS